MPTILRLDGYRFFFFSNENNEPPHVHVEFGDKLAKYWLEPVELASSSRARAHELGLVRRMVVEHREAFLRRGMSTLTLETEPLATEVMIDAAALVVTLDDGRELSVPLEWFPRLRDASDAERSTWRLIGRGEGIHWPELDEDISVRGLLAGHRHTRAA